MNLLKRRALALLTAAVLLLTLFPAAAAKAADEPGYLELDGDAEITARVCVGAGGSDSAAGTAEAPVATLDRAYALLHEKMTAAGRASDPGAVGCIVVKGTVSVDTGLAGTKHVYPVLITGEDGTLAMTVVSHSHLGPTIYRDIALVNARASDNVTVYARGPLTMGEGVTTSGQIILCGAGSAAADRDSWLRVCSGTWRNIYAGPRNDDLTGSAHLLMTGGEVTNFLGACYNASISGDVDITVTGPDAVLSAPIVTGTAWISTGKEDGNRIGGDVRVTVADGARLTGTFYTVRTGSVSGGVTLALRDVALPEGSIAASHQVERLTLELEASEGQTLSIAQSGALTARSFTGGGALRLGPLTLLTLGSVTGVTALRVDGAPRELAYVTAPDSTADGAFVYQNNDGTALSVTAADGVKRWTVTGGQPLKGLSVTVPEGVTLEVCPGFADSTALTPAFVTAADGIVSRFYADLPAGNYHYTVSGEGYYSVRKSFVYTQADAAAGRTLDADPGRTAGDFEPTGTILNYSDELLQTALASDPELWPGYEDVFLTPVFTTERAAHRQTTHEEMLDYLRGLDDAQDDMYLYTVGTSPVYGYEMPVAVFTKTDLSGAATLDEAAALIRSNGKSTIHYQTMIHPNEPASGEAGLAMIRALDGGYGQTLLDSVNVCVIPRINADGARLYQRYNAAQNIDMNRDHMRVQSEEIAMVHRVYELFLPEVTVDGHELNGDVTESAVYLDDVRAATAGSLNSAAAVNDLAQEMVHDAYDALSVQGLRPYNYGGTTASTVNNAIGRAWYGLYGSLSFLVETPGIGFGLNFYERRVVSQYVFTEAIFNYVAAHEEQVRAAVAAGRQEIVERGAVYDEQDVVVLKHGVDKTTQPGYVMTRPRWDQATGKATSNVKSTIYRYNVAEASRPRPTAYVIPRGEAWAEQAIAILSKNGIEHYELEPGSAALLRQYTGGADAAELTEEKRVDFPAGAYVLPMDQVGGNVLAMTMEPDVADSKGYNGTLAQSGIIAASDGLLPIYRYVHDLEDGRIALIERPAAPVLTAVQPEREYALGAVTGLDPALAYEYRAAWQADYTPVPAGAADLADLSVGTYYVRFPAQGEREASRDCVLEIVDAYVTSFTVYISGSGDDAADGRAADRPVRTPQAAYAKLDLLMRYAPEGTEGAIVFTGTVTLAEEVKLPDHSWPVVLTSTDGTKGLSSAYSIRFGGDTRLEHMSLKQTGSTLRYLYAEGHRLELGEGLNCTATGIYFYSLVGGSRAGELEGGTRLIVRSGKWRNVYAAGYSRAVRGDAHLTVTGGAVTNLVQTSYSAATGGSVLMELSGVSVGSNILGGNASSGSVSGDVTIVLGEGMSAKTVYAGSRDNGSVKGTAELILDGGSVGELNGGCANTTGIVGRSVVTLRKGACGGAIAADRVVLDTSGGGTVALSASLAADEAVGGGTVRLPAGQTLTVRESVQGVTRVAIDGTAAEGALCAAAAADTPEGAFVPGGEFALQSRTEDGQRRWYFTASTPAEPGDLNGDGKVNGKDVVLLQRFVAGGYGVTLTDGDLNGDGKVNGKDVVLLQRFVAGGYGVTLG